MNETRRRKIKGRLKTKAIEVKKERRKAIIRGRRKTEAMDMICPEGVLNPFLWGQSRKQCR
jgi:hypothetical protein